MVDDKLDYTEDENELYTDENENKRTRDVTKLEYPLPKGKLEPNHKKILITSYRLQLHGKKKEGFKYTDFSSITLGFSNRTLSSNFKFFESIGLMEYIGKAHYKLTNEGYSIAEKLNYNKTDEAEKELKDVLTKSWFYNIVSTHFAINDVASIEDIINEFALESKAEIPKHSKDLRILIDYLEFVGILNIIDDTNITMNNDLSESTNTDIIDNRASELSIDNLESSSFESANQLPSQSPSNEQTSVETVNEPITTNFKVTNPSSSTVINVDISISLEITPEMTPDDIKGKLDAIISSFKDKNE